MKSNHPGLIGTLVGLAGAAVVAVAVVLSMRAKPYEVDMETTDTYRYFRQSFDQMKVDYALSQDPMLHSSAADRTTEQSATTH